MAKEFIINTSRVNSYGTRVITAGVDTAQFEKNPILLYMHQRGWGDTTPIGRVENLRVEGDRLIGMPVFDLDDEFAAKISRKWENGFLKMCSAGLEAIEVSCDPKHLLSGQTRETITKSKLLEVSIVDIGANDDALQLYQSDGKILQLSAGQDSAFIPLLKSEKNPAGDATGTNSNNKKNKMEKILLSLGLATGATEDDVVGAIALLKNDAQKAQTMELSRIETAVDAAIKAKKTTADKREHFITLGKKAGYESLATTLEMLTPALRPTDIINHAANDTEGNKLEYSKMSAEDLMSMRTNDRQSYVKLYKAEFGFAPEID
ncbi:MAG: HK97 family phage prohead protease [Muribaculaceae bacterium]